ncbi:MAG: type I-U CRISPR-associated protein Csx17, partial [Myxococcota bacterium]
DREQLLEFFLYRYRPTPLVAPWNGGSGFYPKDNKDGIDHLAAGRAERFAPYRAVIAQAQELCADRSKAPKDEAKAALIRACRSRWPGSAGLWLDAALAITSDDIVRFPALLGTGGNDGRLDFTNNQMQRLVELISPDSGEPAAGADMLLGAALFGGHTSNLSSNPIGQFLPGGVGGANARPGFSADSLINPWDFVFMLEGAAVLRVAAVRRLGADEPAQAAAPFAVRSQASGYGSAAPSDESARGEQWLPLWPAPATLSEVRALFTEGRLQSGRQRARRAIDAARAVARLGTARGVSSFVRYGYIERNGQANLAVPLGRWRVRRDPQIHLLDQIEPWVDSLRRAATKRGAPASLERDARVLDRHMLALCREGSQPARWRALLGALGRAEDHLMSRPRSTAEHRLRPLPALSRDWLAAAAGSDENARRSSTVELRLAAAMASQFARDDRRHGLGAIRVHCLPLARGRDGTVSWPQRFATTAEGLARDGRVVWSDRHGPGQALANMAALAARRLLDCRRSGVDSFELCGHLPAHLSDIRAFFENEVDVAELAAMARALMAVDWRRRDADGSRPALAPWSAGQDRGDARIVPAAYGLFRLLYRPADPRAGTLGLGAPVVLDPEPMRLLAAGRVGAAASRAMRRLTVTLGRVKVYRIIGSAALARRLMASLCFPLSWDDLRWLRHTLCRAEDNHSSSEPIDGADPRPPASL